MHAAGLIRSMAAYYRAGHAVTAAMLGREIYDLGTNEDGGWVRHCPGTDAPREAGDALLILLSGPCAATIGTAAMPGPSLLTGEEHTNAWLATIRELESGALSYEPDAAGAWPDNDALALAWALGDTPDCHRDRRIADARVRAAELLTREWADVRSIAACLGATA